MSGYTITASCTICKAKQTITLPDASEEGARRIAELMDGSSPLYVRSPREDQDSMIGRCAQCGGLFDCTVAECPDG